MYLLQQSPHISSLPALLLRGETILRRHCLLLIVATNYKEGQERNYRHWSMYPWSLFSDLSILLERWPSIQSNSGEEIVYESWKHMMLL
jgi:hypothetical protein